MIAHWQWTKQLYQCLECFVFWNWFEQWFFFCRGCIILMVVYFPLMLITIIDNVIFYDNVHNYVLSVYEHNKFYMIVVVTYTEWNKINILNFFSYLNNWIYWIISVMIDLIIDVLFIEYNTCYEDNFFYDFNNVNFYVIL